MEEKRLWELVARKAAGEIDKEGTTELNRLLEKYPDAMYTIEAMGHYWHDQKEHAAITEREEALSRHLLRLEQEKQLPALARGATVRRLAVRLAAAAALILLGCGAWYFGVHTGKQESKTFVASNGTKNHLTLPDGSKVWLNAGSVLTYKEGFGKGDSREVTLSGEGFFEVRHDQQHPFVIHTSKMDIRDIGTRFNVKAYPSDNAAEATLIEGAIEVQFTNGGKPQLLSAPHQKAIAYNNAPSVVTTIAPPAADSLIAETAWMKDMLVFRNESLGELAARLERWYDVKIVFTGEAIRQQRFTGTFSNETIEQALAELQLIHSFKYTDKNGTIVIQ